MCYISYYKHRKSGYYNYQLYFLGEGGKTMKYRFVFLILALTVFVLTGCGAEPAPNTNTPPANTASPDANTTPSMVSDAAGFEKAISKNGVWIICLLNDLTIDKELVLDGEFTNGRKDDKGNDIIQRKIALYEQDQNRNMTARYTLTVPKLTINSPNASIQHGTFKGDLYVNAPNFQLVDTTVEGNIYFSSEEIKNSFTMDEASKVTGEQKVGDPNAIKG